MKAKAGTLVCAVALIAACATTAQFRAGMDQFIGRPISEAEEVFGYNYTKRDLEGGQTAYTWTRAVTGMTPGYQTPGTAETYWNRDGDYRSRTTTIHPGVYYPPEVYRRNCEFTLIADNDGTIVRWVARGEACRGSPGGPVMRSQF